MFRNLKTAHLVHGLLGPLLALVLLVTLAPMAQAQVAVPGFTSGAPRVLMPGGIIPSRATFTTPNPAAMQWGAPSRAGIGQIDGTRENKINGSTADITGVYGGLRYVVDKGSIAVESTRLESNSSNYDFSESSTELGLAGTLADFLSLGVQVSNEQRDFTVTEQETQAQTLGVGFGFSEFLYLGFALEQQDLSFTFAGNSEDYSRQNIMSGIGLRSGGGSLLWHAELYRITRVNYEADDGDAFGGADLTAAVLEFNWNDILIGYSQSAVDYLDGGSTSSTSTLDLGWAPQEGLSVVGRVEQASRDNNDGDTALESDVASITLAVLF